MNLDDESDDIDDPAEQQEYEFDDEDLESAAPRSVPVSKSVPPHALPAPPALRIGPQITERPPLPPHPPRPTVTARRHAPNPEIQNKPPPMKTKHKSISKPYSFCSETTKSISQSKVRAPEVNYTFILSHYPVSDHIR